MDDRHYLIGTSGHVDHGKTELIKALTGIETDRLIEEKQRGISIELGFAHLTLPSGRQVGIVDVPGHERFVRQMLAGASGMDIVLLIVAADEGIMPQTREHLDILSFLGVSRGIVVLSKIDLVDEDWLELVREEIIEELQGTIFAQAPICTVSAKNGTGIQDLLGMLDRLLEKAESKTAAGPVRMPLDRAFTIQGFGTVVTGTLHSGTIEPGQEVAIEPGGILSKVRSLQVHGKKVTVAMAGQRVAVNLAGVEVAKIGKGSVLVTPKMFPAGVIFDLKIQNLPSNGKPIVQRQRVRFHTGTAEVLGRIHLLDVEELTAGQEGYAQILLEETVLAIPGDHFVIRSYSPSYTLAGGKILGVSLLKAKRFKAQVLNNFRLRDQGNPLDLLETELSEPLTLSELAQKLHSSEGELASQLEQLSQANKVEIWPEENRKLFWGVQAAQTWREQAAKQLLLYQQEFPLRMGMGREELKMRICSSWSMRRWQNILEEAAKRRYFRLNGGKILGLQPIELPQSITQKITLLHSEWRKAELAPPDYYGRAELLGFNRSEAQELAQYLVEQEKWLAINGFYFDRDVVEKAGQMLVYYLQEHGEAGVAEVRELWGISRKFAVPLLEYFDEHKITYRKGDKRVLV